MNRKLSEQRVLEGLIEAHTNNLEYLLNIRELRSFQYQLCMKPQELEDIYLNMI
jgi:hypothetical protein